MILGLLRQSRQLMMHRRMLSEHYSGYVAETKRRCQIIVADVTEQTCISGVMVVGRVGLFVNPVIHSFLRTSTAPSGHIQKMVLCALEMRFRNAFKPGSGGDGGEGGIDLGRTTVALCVR